MSFKKHSIQTFFSALIIWTLCVGSLPVKAQDIVTSEDISGGSSVFVFRQSRKAAQSKNFRANPGRSSSAKKESLHKLFAQANSPGVNRRPKTKPVDPNTIAINKPPKPKVGRQTKTPPRVSDEQNSTQIAGAAETYLDRKDYDNAITEFNLALEFNPKNTNAKLGLSDAYVGKAADVSDKISPQAAISYLQKAIAANENNAAAYAALGNAYDAINDNENALKNYDKALALNPQLTAIYAPAGVLYYQKGEIALADNYLTKANALDPKDAEADYYLGLVRFKQNKNDEALTKISQMVKNNPNSAEAHYYLGAVYDRLDRKDESLKEYNQAVALKPDYTEAWFDLGVANYNRENYKEAADDYNHVIALKNDYGQAFFNLAETYRQLAMQIPYQPFAPGQPEPAQNRQRADYFAQANSRYENAAAFIKDDPDLYSNWAFCLARVNKFNLAVEKLNQAIALKPDAVDYTNLGWAYYNAAQVDLRGKKDKPTAKSKLELGKAALQKATEMNPKFKAAFLNLGVTSTALGDFQAAVAALKTAVELQDRWTLATNELGVAYRGLGDLDNAVKFFKLATDYDPKAGAAWYNLGETEYRRGNVKEAKKALDKLKKLNPDAAARLDLIIKGVNITNPTNQIQNKVQQKNPLNKIPKIPF